MAFRRVVAAMIQRRRSSSGERGSVLVEVMVGAVVLAISTAAVLDGLDGAQKTGLKNKNRTVQSTLAQQDIERMRAIPVSGLSNLRQTRIVNVAGVSYTVVSRTDWVRDSTGAVTCTTDQTQANYLKLSSTVTSPASVRTPVKETGLLTPSLGQLSPNAGTATVKLTDRNGQPLAGVTVNLSGPSALSDQTNDLGCVVFGYIPAGTYSVTVPGRVERSSDGTATEPLPVYAGQSSLGQMQVDLPASLRAGFVAPIGQTLPAAPAWDAVTVKNANLPTLTKLFTRAGRSTSVDATGLFPFADGIAVYAGNCAANDPSTYAGQANYFQNPQGRGYTPLDPGDVLRTVNVEMPTLRVNVTRQQVGSPAAVPAWFRTQLLITSLDSGCTATAHQVQPADRATNLNTPVTFDVAVPFGRYRVCAYTRGRTSGTTGSTGSTVINRRYTTATAAGTNPANPADQNLTNAPATPNRQITVTTPSANTAASNGVCF